ncbi:hypothetical protein AAG570_011121 [Ranatra chinensis]|uniref:Uncharacterized protein n=1 Tax=Ranatra chinensis TaxID=642074 RepID=A0ABD0Z802_9HEMI
MFGKNKNQETTEIGTCNLPPFWDCMSCRPSEIKSASLQELLLQKVQHGSSPPITFDSIPIPPASCVRYLGLYIDKRVAWNPHTRLKRIDETSDCYETYGTADPNSH